MRGRRGEEGEGRRRGEAGVGEGDRDLREGKETLEGFGEGMGRV